MFDLGNGTWVAPEFIAVVTLHRETEGENTFEWVTVGMQDSRYTWSVEMNDQTVITPYTKGLRSLGYQSCEDFCAKLMTAIKEAKHG